MNNIGDELARQYARALAWISVIVMALVAGAFALGWWMA